MKRYTLDASGLVRYFVDELPSEAERAFQDAIAGEAVLILPAIAASEAMYVANNREEIAGLEFAGTPNDVITVIESSGPVDFDPMDLEIIREIRHWQKEFPKQLHDAMIVASHVVRETEAVITSDERIAEFVPTVWA